MKHNSCLIVRVLLTTLMISLAVPAAKAAIQVLGVQYQQDLPYNEFDCIWNDKTYPTNCPPRALGCNVHVFVKNTGGGSVTITDATLAGYSLEDSLVLGDHDSRSIYYNWDNPPSDLINAGEPVWYKGDPKTIPAGGVGKVVVRLRTPPVTSTVSVGVVTSGGTVTTNITKDASAPQLASIGYSTDRTKVYLHWRRSSNAAPTSVWLDGTNVTANTTTVGDNAMNFAASVINLSTALPKMSYHVFQGVYADGKTATASQRAWTNKFIYATYGSFELNANYTIGDWIDEAADHGFNNVQVQVGDTVGYMNTSGGEAHCRARDYGYTSGDTTKFNATDPPIDPDMFFLNDEPDAEEANLESSFCNTGLNLPCGKSPMGVLVMREIANGETLRALRPMTPTSINLDGTYRPENYYAWGQGFDVIQVDPYYQRRLSDVYWRDQQRIPLYLQADYIYAVAKATVTGAEPNPANILLFSCEWKCGTGDCDAQYEGEIWPFPTKESKRIEIYYSLAAGAKGMGYWWLKKGYPSNGLADQNRPGAQALWKEMGLCGNEIKTVAPYLVTGHPVDVPLTPSTNVWAKAIASGIDTMILIVVNDNYYNDEAGCHYTPISNATVTATLPSWLQPSPTAFEVSAGGLKAVSTSVNGNQLQVNLGTLSLTKMIVLTKNPLVPVTIQQRYNQSVRPGICAFASELCGNSAPSIIVPPQSQTVLQYSNALFTVVASGYPLPTYQWRFNGANLAGATSDTYTRTNAQVSHNGGYSVVVSNSQGVVTSAVATLTVSTNGLPPSIVTPPQSQTVEVGENAAFTVTASGSAPLSYQWRFNGANISGATTTSYTRSNAQLTDAGSYAVVVTNAAGSITSAPGTLTVTIPCPAANLANASFEGGNTGGVAANWTSYQRSPNPTTVWTIQTASPPSGAGTQYQQMANTSSSGGGGVRQNITGCTVGATYSIAGWMRGNSGLATCTVKVSPTASTSWATATNLTPPATYSGSTWTAFSGTVVATGTNMTVWLDGQTGGTGENKAECFDAIVVTCEEMPAQPPTITQQPSAQNLCAGGTATFTVAATGQGTLTYQWQTNGVNISNGSHYAGCTSTTLWITNVSSADAVNYRCVVTDQIGSTASSSAALTLKTATGFTQHPAATNVCAGGTTTFSVVAVGDGTITYQWQKNLTNISNGGHYSGVTTATLTITGADSSDAANYRCVATAGCGNSTSFQGVLTLRQATSITVQPVNRTVPSGGTTNFSVTATGDGTLTYQWQKHSTNISNGGHYSGVTTATLTISSASSADAAPYRCVVTGGCGNATSSSATLTVCTSPTLLNPSFELSNVSGVATNWTSYQRSPNPTSVWTIQTASPPSGTGTNYQQIANTSSTGGGGVRQDIKNCVIGATYTVAGWMRGNSAAYSTCTVKVSPTASTSWATAINLNPPATFTGSTWTNFSGTVVATSTNMTLWLDGQTTGTGQNKAECFDAITVTCAP